MHDELPVLIKSIFNKKLMRAEVTSLLPDEGQGH